MKELERPLELKSRVELSVVVSLAAGCTGDLSGELSDSIDFGFTGWAAVAQVAGLASAGEG